MWCWQRLRRLIRGSRVVYLGFATLAVVIVFAVPKKDQPGKLKCCSEDHAVMIFPASDNSSSLSLAFHHIADFSNIPFIGIEENGIKCKATALQVNCVGDLLAELSSPVKSKLWPLIAIILDANGGEYLLMIGKQGQTALSSMKYLIEHHKISLKGGYGVEVEIPSDWASNIKPANLYLKLR